MKLANGMPVIDTMNREQIEFYMKPVSVAGYDGIEPMLGDAAALDRKMFKELLDKYHLELAGIRTGGIYNKLGLRFSHPDPAMRKKAVVALNNVIELAAEFDCTVLVGQIQGRLEAGESFESAGKWIADCLMESAVFAQKLKVLLAIEPITRYEMNFNNTTREMMKFLEPINRELSHKVTLLMDVFHMMMEDPSVASAFVIARNMTGHVHFSSCNRDVPGTCEMDFAEYIRILTALGYDKYIALEILTADETTYASKAKAAMDYLRPLIQFAQDSIVR